MSEPGTQGSNQESGKIDEFSLVLATACDIHGIGRGRYFTKRSIHGVVENGIGVPEVAILAGIRFDLPVELTDLKEAGWSNVSFVPDLATLKPLSWLSYGGKQVGHALCDVYDLQQNRRDQSSTRGVAYNQLKALDDFAYDIMMSLELEFTIFHRNTLRPVGVHEDTSQLLSTLVMSLKASGIPVTSVGRGLEPGKLQISLGDQRGIEAADNVHRLRNALRALCVREGYDVTFMTAPLADISANRAHYTITLLTKDGRNAFSEDKNQSELSSIGRHWLAGCLRHHAAKTALGCPTLNCYSGTDHLTNAWTLDEDKRPCRLKVQVGSAGVSIVDKLPTMASNPYLVLAAIVTAGMDGIARKLEPPDLGKADGDPPGTLEDALGAMEANETFQNAIGAQFLKRYVVLKRVFEINRPEDYEKFSDDLEYQRSLYLRNM